jgi:hypothetical protein
MKKKTPSKHRLQVRAEVDRDTMNFIEAQAALEHLKNPCIIRKALRVYQAKITGGKK